MNKIFNLHTNQTAYYLTDLVFSSYQPTCFFHYHYLAYIICITLTFWLNLDY